MIMTNYRMITGRLMWVGCGPAWKRGGKKKIEREEEVRESEFTKTRIFCEKMLQMLMI